MALLRTILFIYSFLSRENFFMNLLYVIVIYKDTETNRKSFLFLYEKKKCFSRRNKYRKFSGNYTIKYVQHAKLSHLKEKKYIQIHLTCKYIRCKTSSNMTVLYRFYLNIKITMNAFFSRKSTDFSYAQHEINHFPFGEIK